MSAGTVTPTSDGTGNGAAPRDEPRVAGRPAAPPPGRSSGGSSSGTDPAPRGASAAADLGLLALAVGTAAGFTRLFDDWSFLTRLAVPLVAAWALALVLRRLHVRVFPAVVIHLAAGVVLLAAMFAPGPRVAGLPTLASLDLLATSVTSSFAEFSRLIAPVAPTDGFLVVIAGGMWVFALFADTAAFRYAGPVQAAIPYLSTFLATGILARDHGRITASICFILGLTTYGVTERTLRASEARWVGRSRARGSRAIGVAAAAIAVVALLGGLALGPMLPGDEEPVIDLRDIGQGAGPRTVVSPFVGLRSLLGVRSDTVMFTVRAEQPAYWRLTALEQFDAARDIWVSHGSYRHTDGELPSNLDPDLPGTELRQDVQISGLAGVWLPGAYEPSEISDISGDTAVSYDRQSASIILRGNESASSLSYRLDSVIPDFEAAASARAGTRADLDEIYLAVPELSATTTRLLTEATEGTTTPFERAIALQDWFRSNFSYDEGVDYREVADPLEAFLTERRGFCQQFSSAFALMARAMGLPSRVAVGFTPGDPVQATTDASIDGAADVQYVVRGRHAHAWPEIYFEGVGWVPFEPTPGRGDPQAADYTGVPAGQATPPEGQAPTTTSTIALEQPSVPSSTASTTPPGDVAAVPPPDATPEQDAEGPNRWIAAVLAVLALGAVVVAVTVRRSRTRTVRTLAVSGGRVGDAWVRSTNWLSMVGLRPQSWETPEEFARRAGQALRRSASQTEPATVAPPVDGDGVERADGSEAAVPPLAQVIEDLDVLAATETGRRYAIDAPTLQECERAEAAAATVEAYVRNDTSRRQRVEQRIRG